MQKIHHLQHVPFEGIGNISEWISLHNFYHTSTHLYENEALPSINDIDILIVMGGPMSVNDGEEISWLEAEKEFIKSAIDNNKTIIGVCLGAQLIANVLGANVYKNEKKEIGFFPLQPVILSAPHVISSAARNLATKFTKLLNYKTVFHWHGETFDLPENAVHLASSEACLNQAFLYKENVLGLQFHLEMNETAIEDIIENGKAELTESTFIQTENKIKKEMKKYCDENRILLFELLNNFLIK